MKLIYGAGKYGEAFLQALEVGGERVAGFIDRFTERKMVAGKPVWRIADAPREYEVIVSVPQQSMAHTAGIGEQLTRAGFEQVVDFDQALHQHPNMPRHLASSNLLWMRAQPGAMLDPQALEQLSGMFADEKSREVLAALVRFRQTVHGSAHPPPDGQREYFPDDVPWRPKAPLRFVDGGAWIGDTTESLLENCRHPTTPVEWIAAFEPDKKNLDRLADSVTALKRSHRECNLFIWPCGVWSENCRLRFSSQGDSASHVTRDGRDQEETIPAVALDSVLAGSSPNYIKLDVEGAEMAALQGARRLITETRPNLAVCVYHRPEDLWEIPLWIAGQWPDYRLYLRLHGPMGLSTVLYCIAPEETPCIR